MLIRRALSASQCASSPSPREDTMPMPVIQASFAPEFDEFGSVMRNCLLRKTDLIGHRVHETAQVGVREGNVAERQRRAALHFAADTDLGGSNGKTRTFVHDIRVYSQQLARSDKAPHLGFLDHGQKRNA